jgi:hypothetical protein
MKKIAKLSLVAAVAVAGLTSANATALEEAIKGVDISGTAVYRYDDRKSDLDAVDKDASNKYKIALNLKASVNEDLTFNTRTIVGSKTDMVSTGNESNSSDVQASFELSQVNFAYTGLANATVIAGKQAVPSPFAVQADAAGEENTGTGLTAVYNAGPVTIAGTYLNQTNLEAINGQDVAGLGLMANAGPVALDAWYVEVLESSVTNSGHAAYTLGAKSKIEMVNLYGRYSAISHDSAGLDTEKLWKVGASAKFGIVGVGVDYGQTNAVAANTTGVSLEKAKSADSATTLQGWKLNLEEKNDASLLKLNVNVDVLPSVNLALNYVDLAVDSASNKDANELYGQVTYKMGKNFMTYARIGQVDYSDAANTEQNMGRLHVQYTF